MPCRAVKVPLLHSSREQEAAGMCSLHTAMEKAARSSQLPPTWRVE